MPHPAGWTAYDEDSVWVGGAPLVVEVDARTGAVVHSTRVGPTPLDGDEMRGTVWVPDRDGQIYPIDAQQGTVDRPIASAASNPFVLTGYRGQLWVVDFFGVDVLRIDPDLITP